MERKTKEFSKQEEIKQKLKESEELYRIILEQSMIGIIIIQGGIVKYANEKLASIYELEPEVFYNWKPGEFLKVVHPDSREFVADQVRKKMLGSDDSVTNYIYKAITQSGKVIWLENYSNSILFQGEPAILAVQIDVTDKVQMESHLKDSEEKYRLLADNINDIIWTMDLDLKTTYVSPSVESVTGNTVQEDMTLPLDRKFTPDSIKKIAKLIREHIKPKNINNPDYNPTFTLEVDQYHKDGSIIPTEVRVNPMRGEDGKAFGLVGITRDITERKKAKKALKSETEKITALNRIITLGNESQSLQEFLEKSYDQVLELVGFDRGGIYLYDLETQHNKLVLHKNVNPKFIEAVKDVDISEGLFSKVFDKNKPFYIEDFSEFMEGSKELGVYSAAIVPLRSKEEYVGSMNVGSPKHRILSQNEFDLLVGIGKQMGIIIQKFESEVLLKKSEEKYREAYNLANFYKDLFAHDMNNILQSIVSAADYYKTFRNNPEMLAKLGDISDVIIQQAKRGASLISNVRKLSKLENSEIFLKPINLSQILNKSIEHCISGFQERSVNIQVNGLTEDLMISGDELLIDVFDNVLNNAIKYNDSEQEILVEIDISKYRENNTPYIRIEVKDHGMGVPDNLKEQLFIRSRDADISRRGMGMGLSLVKTIIDKYEGNIEIKDRIEGDYEKGSNFVMLFKEA